MYFTSRTQEQILEADSDPLKNYLEYVKTMRVS